MDQIGKTILQFKFHIGASAAVLLAGFALLKAAPSLLDVVAYFWPLLLSTALFLATVVVFGRFSPPPASAEKPGEEILDYVAGKTPEPAPGGGYRFD